MIRRRLMRGFAGLVFLAFGLIFAAYVARQQLLRAWLELPEFRADDVVTSELNVPMRDGVQLGTQLYLPTGDGPWPAILVRSPYNVAHAFGVVCEMFARYGYACVHQDVRGRMGSEGEWYPLVHERDDGVDALKWLVAQPWQNGNVALYGLSYLAAVQLVVADLLPPEVKTLVPLVFGTDTYEVMYQDGVFRPEIFTAWAAIMPEHDMAFWNARAYQRALRHRPQLEVDEVFFGARLPWYREWISSPGKGDAYWQSENVQLFESLPEHVGVPTLMITGWYDVFVDAQLEDFARLPLRAQSRLVIGPWNHLLAPAGDQPYPGDSGRSVHAKLVYDWLEHHLRGQPLHQPVGDVLTYAMGEGTWHSRSAFPPVTEPLRFHLDAVDRAPSCAGGALAAEPPVHPTQATFVYDPDDPVPTRGGAALLAFALTGFGGVEPGSFAQSTPCDRLDVLVFRSAPLTEPLHLAGGPRVVLTVASDAPDTTFSAKLLEVRGDGTYNVREAITSLGFRNGASTRQPYAPGTEVEVSLRMWPVEQRFAAGSRLELQISSSSFPMFHPHPNRAEPWAEVRTAVKAEQTVRAGPGRAAYLEIPRWIPEP